MTFKNTLKAALLVAVISVAFWQPSSAQQPVSITGTVQVQSNSANIATQSTLATVSTDVDRAADALESANSNDVAHDAADTGNPVKIGGRADSTVPAAVSADGDRVNGWFNLLGALGSFLSDPSGNIALVDPCASVAKTTTTIDFTADSVMLAATSGKTTYICSIMVNTPTAEIMSITSGTGTVCATSEVAKVGSVTDANGLSITDKGGFSAIGGSSSVIIADAADDDLCLILGSTNRVVGFVTWVAR